MFEQALGFLGFCGVGEEATLRVGAYVEKHRLQEQASQAAAFFLCHHAARGAAKLSTRVFVGGLEKYRDLFNADGIQNVPLHRDAQGRPPIQIVLVKMNPVSVGLFWYSQQGESRAFLLRAYEPWKSSLGLSTQEAAAFQRRAAERLAKAYANMIGVIPGIETEDPSYLARRFYGDRIANKVKISGICMPG
jgi:hypothetical protein